MIADKMKKLLAEASPRLLLDHYWETLDLIAWRISLESEDKSCFTFLELKKKISDDIEVSKSNPIRYREYLNSIKVAKQVIDELIKLGLLLQADNIFRKSNAFSEFFYFIKRIKTSVKKRMAWAIWHLYHSKSSTSFSIQEFLNLLSYSDEKYMEEIQYLTKWKESNWVNLLEREGEEWKLTEKPYHQTTKPILLLDIYYRLHRAILELSKSKNKFVTDEIIRKVRELESECIERFLRKFGLKRKKDGLWFFDDEVIKKVENILFSLKELGWPFFGERPTVNPHFKIEGEVHTGYLDVPNLLITHFLEDLNLLTEKCGEDLETLYNKSIKLKDECNKFLKEKGFDWLSISLRRKAFGKRPFGIRVKIDWEKFGYFLEEFSKREDVPLEIKYEYLFACRLDIAWMKSAPKGLERMVKPFIKGDIREIEELIDSFIDSLSERRKKYRKKLLFKRNILSLTLSYIPEMILTFELIRNMVKKGALSTCYREMRKLLESLAWTIIDDILAFRKESKLDRELMPILPLRNPNHEWYRWARDNGFIVKSLSDLLKPFKETFIGKMKQKFGLSTEKIEEFLYKNMDYPLFLTLMQSDKTSSDSYVPLYKVEKHERLLKESLRNLICELTNSSSACDENFLNELTELLVNGKTSFSLRYPSNSFMIQFLEKMLNLNLHKTYDEYSYFVHSYDKTWQLYPFSSVLEFKIFRNELTRFMKLVQDILNFYDKELKV